MSKGHRQGGKFAGRHTTIIPAAEKFIDHLQKRKEVKKISIGFITHGIKSGLHAIKIMDMDSGVLVKIRGSASIQEIRIYTAENEKVRMIIEEYAHQNNFLIQNS